MSYPLLWYTAFFPVFHSIIFHFTINSILFSIQVSFTYAIIECVVMRRDKFLLQAFLSIFGENSHLKGEAESVQFFHRMRGVKSAKLTEFTVELIFVRKKKMWNAESVYHIYIFFVYSMGCFYWWFLDDFELIAIKYVDLFICIHISAVSTALYSFLWFISVSYWHVCWFVHNFCFFWARTTYTRQWYFNIFFNTK